MIQLDDGEVITEAQQAAAVVEGRGKVTYGEVSKVTSFRLPLTMMVEVQALAVKSGKTKNATIAMLLSVGMEEVCKLLSAETMESLKALRWEAMSDLAPELMPQSMQEGA